MKIIITAGPTREPIDPVRFISNRSSGKMGYAIARAAKRYGHEVILVSGPVCLKPPDNIEVVRIETAEDMFMVLKEKIEWCDVLVMAAAVADWRPAQIEKNKIKKTNFPPTLLLQSTLDILKSLVSLKKNKFFVGFAAETENLEKEAKRKLIEKHLDLVVANNVCEPGSGFDVDTNKVTLIWPHAMIEHLSLMKKDEVAEELIKRIEKNVRHDLFFDT